MMHKHPSFTAWLAMAISIVGFSSVPLFLKHFTHHLDAWTVNGLRYGVAALIWSPVILSNALRANHQPIPWKAAIMPALFNTIGQVGWALAPYHNDAGLMGFVVRTSFLFAIPDSGGAPRSSWRAWSSCISPPSARRKPRFLEP